MYKIIVNGTTEFVVELKEKVMVNGNDYSPAIEKINNDTYLVVLDNKCFTVSVKGINNNRDVELYINNKPFSSRIISGVESKMAAASLTDSRRSVEVIKAPMPGLIVDVLVHDGEAVIDGQPLLILKAMKMENILRASHAGKVKKVLVSTGQKIAKDDVLIQF